MGETVQFLLVKGAEHSGIIRPLRMERRQHRLIRAQNLHFHAGSGCAEIRRLASDELHGVYCSGELFRKALRDFGIPLAGAQPAGDITFVPVAEQAGCQHFPQVLVVLLQVCREIFGDRAVADVPPQRPFKVFPRLRPIDGIGQRRVQQLHTSIRQVGNAVLGVLQKHEIAHAVGRRHRVAGAELDRAGVSDLGRFCLRRFGQHRICLIQNLPVEVVVEAGEVIVKPHELRVVDLQRSPLDGLRALQ